MHEEQRYLGFTEVELCIHCILSLALQLACYSVVYSWRKFPDENVPDTNVYLTLGSPAQRVGAHGGGYKHRPVGRGQGERWHAHLLMRLTSTDTSLYPVTSACLLKKKWSTSATLNNETGKCPFVGVQNFAGQNREGDRARVLHAGAR